MWEYYLAACEMAFRYTPLAVYQIQLTKRVDALPHTRDYIREPEMVLPDARRSAPGLLSAAGGGRSRRAAKPVA